ncbi:hypothetical protein BH09VER1_BH09VER1_36400 [soil metagenome]
MRKKSPKTSHKNDLGYYRALDGVSGDLQLSIPTSEAAILEELEGWIRGGRLAPGHRLPSIKAIQKMLKVGQRGVEFALDSLSRRGLIETRNRSGNYLMADAREILAAESSSALSSSWMLDHYLPRSSQRALTVYTTDCIGRMKAVWNQIIHRYQEEKDIQIRLLTPNDGHLMEVLKTQEVDVIHATFELLEAIGWDKLQEIDHSEGYDDFSADLLPQVRPRATSNLDRCARPFAITVMYLFLNRSMASKFKLSMDIPSNPFSFLRMVREAQSVLGPAGFDSFLVPDITDLLLMTGSILFSPDGRLIFDRELARQTLAELEGSKLRFPNVPTPNLFAGGQALTMRHCSFTCAELLEQVRFDWQALPVPLALGTQDFALLTHLAVPRSSQMPKDAFQFIECLLTRESQSRFAAIGGNLPVRRSALSAVAEADVNHVLPETIHRALAQSKMGWPLPGWTKFFAACPATDDLLAGRCRAEVLVDQIEAIVKSISEVPKR